MVAGGRNMMPIGVAVAAAGIIVGVVNLGLGARIVEVCTRWPARTSFCYS